MMLREIPLPSVFEIWDVDLVGPTGEFTTWPGVVFFDNRDGTVSRDILGVLPIGPAGSHASFHVSIPRQESVVETDSAVLCDQHFFVPREAFVRRRGHVPDRLHARLLRETWNQFL